MFATQMFPKLRSNLVPALPGLKRNELARHLRWQVRWAFRRAATTRYATSLLSRDVPCAASDEKKAVQRARQDFRSRTAHVQRACI